MWVLVVVEGEGYGELTGAFKGRVGGGREVKSGCNGGQPVVSEAEDID